MMTNDNAGFLKFLSNPDVLKGIKYLIFFLESGFVFFIFMVRRQILSMNKTFETKAAGLFNTFSALMLVISLALVFVSLLILR